MRSLARHVYRLALRLYPPSFRARAGESMLEDARTLWREERASGRSGFRVAVRLAFDIARSVPREWLHAGSGAVRAARVDGGQAIRGLTRRPRFTVGVVLLLGIGIASTTVVLSILSVYALRPLPYPEPDRLHVVQSATGVPISETRDLFEVPVTWDLDVFTLLDADGPELVYGAWVSSGYVEAFGLETVIGRLFDPREASGSGGAVALISHALWQRRYGGSPDVVGRSLSAFTSDRPDDAETFTIIGVLPPDQWHYHRYTDFLTPLRTDGSIYAGRLAPGVDPEAAARALEARAEALGAPLPEGERVVISSLQKRYVAPLRPLFRVAVAAVLLVLVIACGNAAALLMVRATRREVDLGVRMALGAGGHRIGRQLLFEGLTLLAVAALIGGSMAAAVLGSAARPLDAYLGRSIPGGAEALRLDPAAFTVAVGLVVSVGVLFSLVPMIRLVRSVAHPGTIGGIGRSSGAMHKRTLSALVAGGVALSLSLVVPATAALRSASHLSELDLGFRADGVWTGSLLLRANSYPDAEAMVDFYERVVASVSDIPGVASAGLARQAAYSEERDPIRVVGEGDAVGSLAIPMEVDGGWFTALDVPVRSGRAFMRQDRPGTAPVAIVSSRLAERLWPDADPVGRRLRLDDGSVVDEGSDGVVWRRVVGVAEDIRPTLTDGDTPVVYLPLAQSPGVHANLVVRVDGGTAAVRPELRDAVGDADPSVALSGIGRLEDTVAQIGRPTRFLASFLAGFAAFALLVAVLGLYAVLSFISIQRRRDLAIRMALGAERRTVTGRFVTESLILIGAGLGLGLVGATALEGYVVTQLQGVTRLDPLTYGASIGLMVLSGLLAAWIPARKATGVDPMSVLRQE